MSEQLTDVMLIIVVGTLVLLAMAGFVTMLMILYRRKYLAHQTEVALLHETHRREILTAQLETQNQTFQQVAEDLHDHVGQMLSVVWLHLNCLHADTKETPYNASVTELLTHTATLVADVRSLSKSLSTDTITRFGLCACLELEVDRINRAGSAPIAVMQVTGETYSMGQQTEIILLRMVQEALNNALKHAPGTLIALALDYTPDQLLIEVNDQGPGFSLETVQNRTLTNAGQGVYNLQRRANLLGGTCTWQTGHQQQGTTVQMLIPRRNPLDVSASARAGKRNIVTN